MLYRSCDVLVHPYRGEGFGLPIAEAMASGLPVIVTGYGACLDFCDEDNALLVPATGLPSKCPTWARPPSATGGRNPTPTPSARSSVRVVDEPGVARRSRCRPDADGSSRTSPGMRRRARPLSERVCRRRSPAAPTLAGPTPTRRCVPSVREVASPRLASAQRVCVRQTRIAQEREARLLEQRRAEHGGFGRDGRPLFLARRGRRDVAEAGGQSGVAEQLEARGDGSGSFHGEAR